MRVCCQTIVKVVWNICVTFTSLNLRCNKSFGEALKLLKSYSMKLRVVALSCCFELLIRVVASRCCFKLFNVEVDMFIDQSSMSL